MYKTGVVRLDFQIAAAEQFPLGIVLNLGSNEDPAGLRQRFGSRVVNCDLMAFDHGMNRPNVVDKVFDMTQYPWPFSDDYAKLCVFGDVLEHFPYRVIVEVLKEAYRVATNICITVPEDHRIDQDTATYRDGEYNQHVTVVTEDLLKQALADSGWTPYLMVQADWGFEDGTFGHCCLAQRVPESVGAVATA